MHSHFKQLDDGVVTVSDVFTPQECSSLIARAASLGSTAATVLTSSGPQVMTHIRNNDRVVLDDTVLAAEMWDRIKHLVPVLASRLPCGVNGQLRFDRYVSGQQLKFHKDGAVTNEAGKTSNLSYLVYLNDDREGCATRFRELDDAHGKLAHN